MQIGVDLGGTKIEIVALATSGETRFSRRTATPRGDYDATIRTMVDLVEAAERGVGERCSVGVGIPGALSPLTGLVKNANSTWLNGRPLDVDLSRALGRTVRLANDANCFALSEATDGAAAGAPVVFGVILGTGTGGGLVVRGDLLVGPDAIAGEWGHNALPWPDAGEWPGPPCYCGRRGCIETFLSGSGLQRAYDGSPAPDAQVIAAAAAAGDAAARAAVDRYAGRLAKALASVINLLDPDVIVLGGGLSNIATLYDAVPQRWGAWIFSDAVSTRLRRALHGDASGVRGAARLWPADESRR